MLDAGYKESTAIRSTANKSVQISLTEIKYELKESDITVEFVLRRLNEDRDLAIKNKDYSVAARVDELIGKTIAAFKDRIEGSLELNFIKEALELYEPYQTLAAASYNAYNIPYVNYDLLIP